MNVFTHVATITTGLTALLAIYALRVDPRARVNQVFALLCLSLSLWAMGYALQLQAEDKATAWFWYQVTAFPGVYAPLLLLHFFALLTRQRVFSSQRWILPVIYVFATLLFIKGQTGQLYGHDLIRTPFGWDEVVPLRFWPIVYVTYAAILTIGALVVAILWLCRVRTHRERRQAALILWGLVPTTVAVFLFEIFFRLMGWHAVPGVAPVVIPLWCMAIAYAVARYGFLRIDPASAANEILSTISDGLLLLDTQRCVLTSNEAARALLGVDQAGLAGRQIAALFPDEPLLGEEFDRRTASGPLRSAMVDYRGADGRTIPLNLSATRVNDEFGDPLGTVIILRDMTEVKQLEQNLQQASKMEAIGQLAGGVAHDFNNLLTVIHSEIESMRRSDDGLTLPPEGAAAIEEASKRAAELTAQLLGFARKGKHQVIPIDLHQTIGETLKMLSRTLDKKIEIALELEARHSTVIGDPGQLQQVLLNIAINARDAMPTGGALRLRTADARPGEAPAALGPGGPGGPGPGDYIELTISDTGSGIAARDQPRVFEPFFTTKEQGRGSGMGLATAYGIVDNHGGAIAVDSTPGEGTTFTVWLPRASDAEPEEWVKRVTPVTRLGKLLIIDDEQLVRRSLGRTLSRMGYSVVEASGGAEGLALYTRDPGAFDIVLVDVIMPGMGGKECFRAIRAIDASTQVILMSGYSHEGTIQETLDEGALGFVGKPVDFDDLVRLIEVGMP